MAAQGIWSGTISFSLVAIPVRLVPAVAIGRVSFHLLHKKDNSRLSRRLFCPVENAMVPPDEVVRGYEILPDKFITVTDEELESLTPERSRTIEIVDFIDAAEVDPVYFDHPYYLVPAKGGEKAYQLLVEVLRRTNKAGIARFVLAEREHLVAVASRDGALALTTLHYSEDILPVGDFAKERGAADAKEEAAMRKSIKAMVADFDPEKYADDRRNRIREILDKKVKEHALVEAPVLDMEGEGPPDLVAALEESMRSMKEQR
jgi:DNA end-binding protein Ku